MPLIVEIITDGAALVFSPTGLSLILLGVLLGMLVGIIPGIGGVTALVLLIPLTFGMEPVNAFILLAALKGGTNFGGSLTSILLNTPGSPPNAATLLDGYPMARAGEAGRAIGASAYASAGGAVIGVIVLLLSLPLLREISLLFGAPEIFWLTVWGITAMGVVVRGSVVKGLLSGALGVLVATHGWSIVTGTVRYDYGLFYMREGFGLVPPLVGLFAIAEMLRLTFLGQTITDDRVAMGTYRQDLSEILQGGRDVLRNWVLFVKSSLIGLGIGTIPGVGGTVANYIAYFQASQTESNAESFGNGDVRGVIASEASNDAKDGGAFIPTLGLGIPGSASMAVLLGAFILHGMQVGPFLLQNHPEIISVIIVSLLVSNLLTSLIGIFVARYLIHITSVDIFLIAPVVLVVSFTGAYATDSSLLRIGLALLFGVLGFVMILANISRIPMVLAIVLTPILEQNMWVSLQISSGDPAVFVRSPLAGILILLIAVSVLAPLYADRRSE